MATPITTKHQYKYTESATTLYYKQASFYPSPDFAFWGGWACRGDEWIGLDCQTRCASQRLSKRTPVRHRNTAGFFRFSKSCAYSY